MGKTLSGSLKPEQYKALLPPENIKALPPAESNMQIVTNMSETASTPPDRQPVNEQPIMDIEGGFEQDNGIGVYFLL